MKNYFVVFSIMFMLSPAALSAAPSSKTTPKARLVMLPFSISVGVPASWRVDDAKVGKLLTTPKASRINALDLTPDRSGHLLTIASPLHGSGEASAEISVSGTHVSQQTVAAMTQRAMITAEWQFLQDIKTSASASGVEILEWHSMTKERVGNVVALVLHYKYRMPGSKSLNMDSYGIYLGSKSVKLRLQYTDEEAPALKAGLDQVKGAFRIEKTDQ